MTTGKRQFISKGKGYLNAAGPQARFILFLFGVLIAYTFILLIFRKMAEMLQLQLFVPIALSILVVFIGIVGAIYSHRYFGPLARIRRTIDYLADGDTAVTLRVRENDDPQLRDLAASISRLCDHSRNQADRIQHAAREFKDAVDALRKALDRGADGPDVQAQFQNIREKQAMLEHIVRTSNKA